MIDEEADLAKARLAVMFLDAILVAQDAPTMRSVVDELMEDLPGIVTTLLHWFNLCEQKQRNSQLKLSEDVIILTDFQSKSLSVLEILTSTKGTKSSFKDTVSTENPCIRSEHQRYYDYGYFDKYSRQFQVCCAEFENGRVSCLQVIAAANTESLRSH